MAGRTQTPKPSAKSDKRHPGNRLNCSSSPFNPPRPAEPQREPRLVRIIRSMNTQDTR